MTTTRQLALISSLAWSCRTRRIFRKSPRSPRPREHDAAARFVATERKLDKTLHINGPLTTCVATVKATLHEIEASIAIQNEGFENLIRGSKVMMDDVLSRAPGNWYIEANEARSLGLVSDVL